MNKKNRSRFRRFSAWVEGEKPPLLSAAWKEWEEKESTGRTRVGREPTEELRRFFRRYHVWVVLICALLLLMMTATAMDLPAFGSADAPTNNIVVERYVSGAEEETGAENVIAGMILNYRGFDTFGESCVLFLAVCCVMMLLWTDERNSTPAEREAQRKEEAAEEPDVILRQISRTLIPCVLLFGFCVLMNGHVSPGGGFSGGSVLGASLILFTLAFGSAAIRRFFSERVFNVVRISGLLLYAGMFGVYIYFGANGIESELSRYIVLVIDVAVGLVVMSTMYGFYSFYTRGEL